MALDRQSIEKKDFPMGRRGYDPEAVDAHLNALADEITDFKSSARRRSDTLASSASDRVRAIVEAAEASAADIEHSAETEAREIRDEANNEARATREQAAAQARDHVGKVSESTAAMLQRIDAMESELASLIDGLRTGGNRLDSDLRLLEADLRAVGDSITPKHQCEPEEDESVPPAPAPEVTELSDEYAPIEEASSASESHDEAPEAAQAESSDDAEGARLIALNMVLNGTPRDETARYLTENFSLADSDGLLDEVYASVEG